MVKFALGSLACVATTNPTFGIKNLLPALDYNLSLHSDCIIALCACIMGLHFVLFALAVYTSRLIINTIHFSLRRDF